MAERNMFDRVDRVSKQVHQILADLLLHEVRDPSVQAVQITAVEVTRDLQIANVYYVLIDDQPNNKPSDKHTKGLRRISGFLRKKLGEELTLRHTPELRFLYDSSIERARHMENLLSSIEIPPEDPQDSEDPEKQ